MHESQRQLAQPTFPGNQIPSQTFGKPQGLGSITHYSIMSDSNQQNPTPEPNKSGDTERTKQVTVFGWTAGVCAFFAGITLSAEPTWPVAFGIATIAVAGAFVFLTIFKRG
jgi:hypothetical protein